MKRITTSLMTLGVVAGITGGIVAVHRGFRLTA